MSRNVYAKCQVQFLSFFFYGYLSKIFQLTSLPVGRVLENMDDTGTAVRKTRGIRIDYRKLVDIQIPRSQRRKKTTKSRTGQDSEDVTLYPVALLPERSTDN